MSTPMPTGSDLIDTRGGGGLAEWIADLLEEHPVVDGHTDVAWAMSTRVGRDLDRLDVVRRDRALVTALATIRTGQRGAQLWSVCVPGLIGGDAALLSVLEQVDFLQRLCERYSDTIAFARTAREARHAMLDGRVAAVLGVEGGHSIAGSLGVLRMLAALGARYMTLTHNESLDWADSATDEPKAHGLTEFGRNVVAQMNELGMLVDLSHVSRQTMHAALDCTRAPAVFTHSSCRALTDHPRNVPDDVLSRLSENGGVCMVALVPHLVSQAFADWWLEYERIGAGLEPSAGERARFAWVKSHPRPEATAQDAADHVDHVREVAGLDHIGIGGDSDGCDVMSVGSKKGCSLPALFTELGRRGWNKWELSKLANGNVLRILEQADDGYLAR